ncbi:MAG TPA: pilin [Candidatus Pacearchaeota archaeon]|nr:pilin [Candidatus Pacearchaeota archaeon]HOL90214.1 pilin [Candidatus Pacearchaeota archaeon]HPQ22970.1 pilin [Candidatus Paceibacterota bacterium]
MKRKYFLFFLISLFFLFFGFFTEAIRLEVNYPEILGYKITNEVTLPKYVVYIFYFALGVSGIVALGMIVYAGFKYFTSFGNPEKIKDAKDQILNAIVGLVILFISVILLNTLNPQIVKTDITPPVDFVFEASPGIYLCKEEVNFSSIPTLIEDIENRKKTIQSGNFSENDIKNLEEKVEELRKIKEDIGIKCMAGKSTNEINKEYTRIYFLNEEGESGGYGAFAFSEKNFEGRYKILDVNPDLTEENLGFNIGSLLAVKYVSPSSENNLIGLPDYLSLPQEDKWKLTLYKYYNFNEGFSGNESDIEEEYEGEYGTSMSLVNLPFSPLSFKKEGKIILVFLRKIGDDVKAKAFINDQESNLAQYDALVEINCPQPYKCERKVKIDYITILAGEML